MSDEDTAEQRAIPRRGEVSDTREAVVRVVRWRARCVDVVEADVVESQREVGRARSMGDASQCLIHGRRLVIEAQDRQVRIADHGLEEKEIVADRRHVPQAEHRVLEVVEEPLAEHHVEAAQMIEARLDVGLPDICFRAPRPQRGDVLRPRLRRHHRASAFDEEAGEVVDACADLQHVPSGHRKIERGEVPQARLVKRERRGGFEALEPTPVGACLFRRPSTFEHGGMVRRRFKVTRIGHVVSPSAPAPDGDRVPGE